MGGLHAGYVQISQDVHRRVSQHIPRVAAVFRYQGKDTALGFRQLSLNVILLQPRISKDRARRK